MIVLPSIRPEATPHSPFGLHLNIIGQACLSRAVKPDIAETSLPPLKSAHWEDPN